MQDKQLALTYPGNPLATIAMWTDYTTDASFKFRIARATPLSFDIWMHILSQNGHLLYAKAALEKAASPFDISVPVAVMLIDPSDQATGVTMDTPFRWIGANHSLYVLLVSTINRFIQVITTEMSLRLSDLGQLGITLSAGTLYSWRVYAYGPFSSIDEAASPRGIHPAGDWFWSDVTPYRFSP